MYTVHSIVNSIILFHTFFLTESLMYTGNRVKGAAQHLNNKLKNRIMYQKPELLVVLCCIKYLNKSNEIIRRVDMLNYNILNLIEVLII